MKIGETKIEYGLCLAPMAGYTDKAMRAVCHSLGAEYAVTEMVSAKAVCFGDKKTYSLAAIGEDEGAVALQLFGKEPQTVAEAARVLSNPKEGVRPVAIDINMGCPVKKIFSNGEGSALMRNPELIHDIVKATVNATDLPVTVKLRAGIDRAHLNAVECALAAESAGAAAVCIHGRTTSEMYSGKADREIIRAVKEALKLPVIANGDVTDAESALEMLRDTGADGIAIGRGAVGNPFIFSEIKAALRGEKFTPPSYKERTELALLQLRAAIIDKGEERAVNESRKQIALYLHDFRGAASLRGRINSATTYTEIEAILSYAEKSMD